MRYANDDLVTALQWCKSNKDFSRSREAAHLLDARAAALQLISELHQSSKENALELKEALQKVQRQLAANPTARLAVDAADAELVITSERERSARSLRHAERAFGAICSQASTLLSGHEVAAELLPIIAAERCIDPTACNDDAVSRELLCLWRSLRFEWHPRWQANDDELTLPHRLVSHAGGVPHSNLPLTWSQLDHERMRASLAWVWQQLAARRFAIVPMPTGTRSDKPETQRMGIKLTAFFDGELPKVPKTPKPERGSSFQVIGISK